MDTSHPHAALEGATVVVTRPAGTSAALVRRLRDLGARALSIPGLALRPIEPDARRLRKAAFEDWIFTSPAAVGFGAVLLPPRRARARLRAYAIGEGTARALARHGIVATVPRDRFDSEGLLALREFKRVRGRRIALDRRAGRARSDRTGIAPTRRDVEAIHVYRRVPPR